MVALETTISDLKQRQLEKEEEIAVLAGVKVDVAEVFGRKLADMERRAAVLGRNNMIIGAVAGGVVSLLLWLASVALDLQQQHVNYAAPRHHLGRFVVA